MQHFKFFNKKDILSLTKVRRYETKLGERIQCLPEGAEWPEALGQTSAKYILLGIPEDIGVHANHGQGGADTAWYPFLNAFLNIQSNDFLSGESILLLGQFDFGDIKYLIENNAYNPDEKIDAYRHAVNMVDEEVEQIIKAIAFHKKIPIIIGGGQNNAYPIIKGVAKGMHKNGMLHLAQVNCINLDAHADYRPMEGRHSGNAFRYAEADGYLGKYAVIGLHQNYLQQNVLSDLHENHFIHYSTYEDIFIHERKNFIQAVAQATGFTEDTYTGIELDLDSIEQKLSSSRTPSGITALHARQYLNFTGTDAKVAYIHLCEGACQIQDGPKDEATGKLLSYLVSDFVKANLGDN